MPDILVHAEARLERAGILKIVGRAGETRLEKRIGGRPGQRSDGFGGLRTGDGGATWRSIRSPGVMLGSVFSTSSAGVLWAGTQGDAGPVPRPVLDVSRDAGRTWTDARLPGLVGSLLATNTVLAPPAFFGATGIVAVDHEPTTG